MDFVLLIIALLYLALAGLLIHGMVTTGKLELCHLGIIGVFSIGYYVLPVVLRPLSNLAFYSVDDIVTVLALHGLFLISVVIGVLVSRRVFRREAGMQMPVFDGLFARHRRKLFVLATVLYSLIFTFTAQTSYSAEHFVAYFTNRNPLAAGIATVASLSLATVALVLALEFKMGNKTASTLMTAVVLGLVGLSLSTAQRLAIITPLTTVLASLFVTGQKKRAVKWAGLLLTVLFLVSPFAVFLREEQSTLSGSNKALSVAHKFSYGDDIFITSLRSLVDRSDLLGNSIILKDYIDGHGYVGWTYYYSVLVAPIPRVFFPNKPFILSDDGTMKGEISVIAWSLEHNGIGSLTAFGGITAYRQGGWIAVFLDGLATGVFFVFLARWLGKGGLVGNLFYIALLPALAIKEVPPSFLSALVELLPLLTVICILKLANWLLANLRENVAHVALLSPFLRNKRPSIG